MGPAFSISAGAGDSAGPQCGTCIHFVGQGPCALPCAGTARDGGGTHGCRPTGAGRLVVCGRTESSGNTEGVRGSCAGRRGRRPLQGGWEAVRNVHPFCRAGPVCPAVCGYGAGRRRHTRVPPYRGGAVGGVRADRVVRQYGGCAGFLRGASGTPPPTGGWEAVRNAHPLCRAGPVCPAAGYALFQFFPFSRSRRRRRGFFLPSGAAAGGTGGGGEANALRTRARAALAPGTFACSPFSYSSAA